MKKHLLPFALLLFFATQTKAQTSVYHPFPDSNAYWDVGNEYDNGCIVIWEYAIFLNGDTTISGNLYHKLYENGHGYSTNCPGGDVYFSNQYYGGLRQDTMQKRVFMIQPGSSSDTLLYDFNLALGDTLLPTLNTGPDMYQVTSVDSILIGNDYRKSFHLSSNAVLIEGIGSNFGLVAPLATPFEYVWQLNCFSRDNQTLYPNSNSSCYFLTSQNELAKETSIMLSPNPATSQLTILTSSFHQAVTVSVMNVMGQEASPLSYLTPNPSPLGEGSASINVSGLAAGMYFLQLKWEGGSVVKRFVKE